MTIEEVKNILGDAYYMESKSKGSYKYKWCDAKDQKVSISFKDDGKVFYVGSVI